MSRQIIDLTGQIFDRWTVIERVENSKYKQTYWLCECICGNKSIIRGTDLRSGRTKSCGCLHKIAVSLPYGEASFHHLYYQYKQNAIKRGLEWNLTMEQFRILIDGNCIYCGIEPLQELKRKYCNGSYIYNGIDRMDNAKGYTVENCVSCCKICNGMKGKLSKNEFLEYIEKIYKNSKEN